MPLEWFDDTEAFEKTSLYMSLANNDRDSNTTIPAQSRYFFQGAAKLTNMPDWEWRKCVAIQYNPSRNQFLIQWDDAQRTKKWVSRLNIMFEGEDRNQFYLRIERAVKARNEVEAEMEYNKRIAGFDVPNMAPLPDFMTLGTLRKVGMKVTNRDFRVLVSPYAPKTRKNQRNSFSRIVKVPG
jgi:hypothetical protein